MKGYVRTQLKTLHQNKRQSPQTDPSRTGANCWETAPPSPPCWIASFIMVMFSNAVRGVGVRK